MGLFNRNKNDELQEEQPKRQANPTTFALFRLLAMGYMLYLYYEIIQLYRAGGEDAPSVGFLIGSGVFFVGGAAFIAWLSWREYKRLKAAQAAAAAEEELLAETEEIYEYRPTDGEPVAEELPEE